MEKHYSIDVQDGRVVSIEVDGIFYSSPEEITNPTDRVKIYRMISEAMSEEAGADDDDDFDAVFDQDFEEHQKRAEQGLNWVPLIFLGVALVLLLVTALLGSASFRRQSVEQPAPGQVVDLMERTSYDSEDGRWEVYYFPVVEFTTLSGVQRVELDQGAYPPEYSPGEEVTVLYDPDKPTTARIQSFSSTIMLWLAPGITGFIGAVFLAISLVILFAGRRPSLQAA